MALAMNAQQRVDNALTVALEAVVSAGINGEITPQQVAQVVDLVTAALNTVQRWAPEWETSAVEL